MTTMVGKEQLARSQHTLLGLPGWPTVALSGSTRYPHTKNVFAGDMVGGAVWKVVAKYSCS